MGLSTPTSTSEFYDRWTELFVDLFGPVLQAGLIKSGDPPNEDPVLTVLELARRSGLRDGDRVVDAGCGVAGPAAIIAQQYPNVLIDGVTISPHQISIARAELASLSLSERVRLHLGDYQQLPLRSGTYDQVFFFETTGYATDLCAAFREAHRALRVGGRVYVKDVFRESRPLSEDEVRQMEAFDELWACAGTKTIPESVRAMEEAGFQLQFAREMEDIGTSRFVGSLFTMDESSGLHKTELGAAFTQRGLNPPIIFGEISALKP